MGRIASILLVIVVLGIAMRACLFPSRNEPGELQARELVPQAPSNRDGAPIALFNGRDLENWETVGDARFTVEDGCIVGETGAGKANAFLATRSPYADFRLELELRLLTPGNSGVQVRSEIVRTPDGSADHVRGYQVEVDPSPRSWSGGLYEERGRGWLADLKDNEAARRAFRTDDWNHYSILCQGAHFVVKVNGITTCDTFDGARLAGCIALQIHSGPKMRMTWKNLRLTPLGASEWQALAQAAECKLARDASVRIRAGGLMLRAGGSGSQPVQELGCIRWDAQGIRIDTAHTELGSWKLLEAHMTGSRLVLVADGKRVRDAELVDCPTGELLRCDAQASGLEQLAVLR